jgi:hypothetical protein
MDERREGGNGRASHTVWVLTKDGHTMTCVISGEPGREDLQVLFDREVYLEEVHTVREGTIARARTLLHGFEAHGWAPVDAAMPPR